jgi:hypothetical protein
LVFAAVFRGWLDMAHVTLDPETSALLQLAKARPTSALLIPMPAPLRTQLLPVLQNASINAYQAAMGAGVLIGVAGALVAFLGIRNQIPARSSGPHVK